MNNALETLSNRTTRFLMQAVAASLLVLVGGFASPAMAATPDVTVDQQPLVVAKPLPPNIVLMLDDSGSMARDIMPDWTYLGSRTPKALVNHNNNGVYFNPNVEYKLPPKANGDLYPASNFDSAWVSGFKQAGQKVKLNVYTGWDDDYLTYTIRIWDSDVSYADAACPYDTRWSSQHEGYCYYDSRRDAYNRGFDFSDNGYFYVYSCGTNEVYATHQGNNVCVSVDGTNAYKANPCESYQGVSNAHPGYCSFKPQGGHSYDFYDTSNEYYYEYRCDSRQDAIVINALDEQYCISANSFFTYSTGTSGSYVRHYVADSASDCTNAGLAGSVCTANADIKQSVANWFSYYHTRMLMAQSGLMRAFVDLDSDYRFGFGSINANNKYYIDDSYYEFNNEDGSTGDDENRIAEVKPFGDTSDPNATSRKENFWQWIDHADPGHNTPLRSSLKAVGEYYKTEQPWTTMSSDPSYDPNGANDKLLACRQSYAILTTDGFWNSLDPSVGDPDDTDGTSADEIQGINGQTYTYDAVPPFADSEENTLADVAMEYWRYDLMDGIDNAVPVNDADPAFWQHMVTFTLGMGFDPVRSEGGAVMPVDDIMTWARSGGGTSNPDAISGFTWPDTGSGDVENISDMVHAAVNGHGGFYQANNPASFVAGIKSALAAATARTGSGASIAAGDVDIGNRTYQATYHSGTWTGDLKASEWNPATEMLTERWSAAAEMPAAADRVIYTYNPDAASGGYVEFKTANLSSLSTAQQQALGSDDTAQQEIINYLRGDASLEQINGGSYRSRTTVLGDIVHSRPVYVGGPSNGIFTGSSFTGLGDYATFVSDHDTRNGVVYVSANDGMLHAFDSGTGEEVYAYLPGSVITHGGKDGAGNVVGISAIANPAYGHGDDYAHQYFNDGRFTISPVYLADGKWHSVLVGTTGRGLAKTVYALDVTDPGNIKFMWERSAHDGEATSDYIGQMVGIPIIAQVADGDWVVLVGNGYNSAKGTAALLQFDLDDGSLEVYDTGKGDGLASPAVWMGSKANGISTVAYAGDLEGNVWSFQLAAFDGASAGATTKLFTAKDADGNVQPITARMVPATNPRNGDRWLFFGTGKYLAGSDIVDTSAQSWYGLIVKTDNTDMADLSAGRGSLAKREITLLTSATAGALGTRAVSEQGGTTVDITDKAGWYMDLPVSGERMVDYNMFIGGTLIGTTKIPNSQSVCNPTGTGWIMAISPFTGTASAKPFFDANNDGVVDQDDAGISGIGDFDAMPNPPTYVEGDGNGTLPRLVISLGDGGRLDLVIKPGSAGSGRVSWRELVNQ